MTKCLKAHRWGLQDKGMSPKSPQVLGMIRKYVRLGFKSLQRFVIFHNNFFYILFFDVSTVNSVKFIFDATLNIRTFNNVRYRKLCISTVNENGNQFNLIIDLELGSVTFLPFFFFTLDD